jgi:hypothetical protein
MRNLFVERSFLEDDEHEMMWNQLVAGGVTTFCRP